MSSFLEPTRVPSPAVLPLVEIRAVPLHRWRARKWLVCLVEPGSGRVRQHRCTTFDDAVGTARRWSLAHRAGLTSAQEPLDDTNAAPEAPWQLPGGFTGGVTVAG